MTEKDLGCICCANGNDLSDSDECQSCGRGKTDAPRPTAEPESSLEAALKKVNPQGFPTPKRTI
jgi:hypothetical protein